MYTTLEQSVLELLLQGDDKVLQSLRQQFQVAQILKREQTGVGFFLSLYVPDTFIPIHRIHAIKADFCFGDVGAHIPGLESGTGFLLWVKNGYLDCLEAYTYYEPWPVSIDIFSLFYFSENQRQIDVLQQAWQLE